MPSVASRPLYTRKGRKREEYGELQDSFDMFEDNGHKNLWGTRLFDEEGSGSSDKGDRMDSATSSMDVSRLRSGGKPMFGNKNKKDKRAKIFAMDLSNSVNCASSASEKVAAKINSLVRADVPDANTLMKELLSIG
ncbi:Hypothetical predicted protein [Olea europaea subsp. europaea]|uniref:Uncharacterized protein n=1 Tax=Olea europaea subsp. europaea TaxID=158383 RepID=A0A8S0S087_OLEEU|nr:Hypothetical predicted protein [Olea europaea subsp. europaea]